MRSASFSGMPQYSPMSGPVPRSCMSSPFVLSHSPERSTPFGASPNWPNADGTTSSVKTTAPARRIESEDPMAGLFAGGNLRFEAILHDVKRLHIARLSDDERIRLALFSGLERGQFFPFPVR